MRLVYANGFGAPAGDLLVTDEVAVAAAAPAEQATVRADALLAPDRAEALNAHLWRVAFTWAAAGGEDPTRVGGISAADLAGGEARLRVLMPVGRGVLEAEAVLAAGHAPSEVVLVRPAEGSAQYRQYERLQGDAFAATIQALSPTPVTVTPTTVADARNATLVTKYSITRDYPALPREDDGERRRQRLAALVINGAATLRGANRRRRLLIVEYHPTQAFARRRSAAVPALLSGFPREAIGPMLRAGDRAMLMPPGATHVPDAAVQRALATHVAAHGAELSAALAFDGHDLWPLVAADLCALAAEYADWLRGAQPVIGRALRRGRVRAALVPFDTPPFARLIVRMAQAAGQPTFILNDGWKGDDYGQQGMTADTALATSAGILEQYFCRHPHADRAVLTGDPRADGAPVHPSPAAPHEALRRIVVGSFTFSPIDLNCRRSDPEAFLEVALEAIRASPSARGAHVVLKLHPADRADAYADVLARFADLSVEVVTQGDVTDMFGDADLYLTTYSTSLLQAAGAGVPFLYLAINPQRLHPPFHPSDPLMARRMASDAAGLTALLESPEARTLEPAGELEAWLTHHVGPADGQSTARVEAAVSAPLRDQA